MAITTPSTTPPGTSVLQFVRKGQVQGLGNVPPTRTLLELLRDDLRLTGTKEGCRSGDCGVCTVVLGQPDGHGGLHYRAVNSCIQLAHAAHGQALWTVEDLAQSTQPHPVQQALVQHHASQCGFCTPGFVMSLFALYQTRLGESARQGTPPAPVTRDQALHALSGNLCRCTGYRPILDAAQTMVDVPVQTVDEAATVLKLEQITHTDEADKAFFIDENQPQGYLRPTTLANLLHARARFPQAQLVAGCTDVGIWVTKLQHAPAQVLDLTRVAELRRIEHVAPPHGAQATPTTAWLSIGAAVTLTDAFDALVATRPALATFTSRFAGLPVRNAGTLGGNVANGSPIGDSMPLLLALGAHVRLMQWDDSAARTHADPAPAAPTAIPTTANHDEAACGAGTLPSTATALQSRTLPLEQFYTGYRQTVMLPTEVLTHILVPPPGTAITPHPDATTLNGEWLRAYKISKRFEDDISAVCLGLRLVLRNGVVAEASIGVGGVAATPVRALQTQAVLLGQPWTQATASQAAAVLQAEFAPISDMRASAAYRRAMLAALLQRAWVESTGVAHINLEHISLADLTNPTPKQPAPTDRSRHMTAQPVNAPVTPSTVAPAHANPKHPAAASAPTAHPVPPTAMGHSHAHESAQAQVRGASPYVDDLPETVGTLHAAPVLSPVAHGTLHGLDASAALALPGVVAVLTAADIPGDPVLAAFTHDEPILATGTVHHVGQVMALVVATDVTTARRAARLVRPSITPLPPVLHARDAHAAANYVLPPVRVARGDAATALARAPHTLSGAFEVGGQEHFYLEGQIAYALPQEQQQWLIHSSTQHPGEIQHWVAHALGLALHQVRVECRRMGGGFGGKETQSGHLAVWAALAAQHTGRPVKMRLDRDDDFLITGKRHPFSYDYTVGFDDQGHLCGLQLTQLAHCGFSADLSGPVSDRAIFHADNAYFLQDVAISSFRCKTNTQSHTAYRGFGGPQGVIAIETILGDVARHLGLDPLAVRLANLYADETLTQALPSVSAHNPTPAQRNVTHYGMAVEDNILLPLIAQLADGCSYQKRKADIAAWNASSPVIQRGLALTPVKFGISFTATQFNQAGALVHVYTDGSVLVNHGGTEMGQGLHTKVAQIVASELGLPLHRVQVSASDTARVPNASATAASSGTDLNGRAAQYAARNVRTHLAAFVAGLDSCGAGEVRLVCGTPPGAAANAPAVGLVITPTSTRLFDDVVQAAYTHRIQLWSDGFYRTPKIHYDKATLTGRPFYYFAYGAACTEVAVDTLTGESRVLAVDILHDVGHSINPAIDIGQVEGAFVQGMGWLTTEELVWAAPDAERNAGALLTRAPSTYKIPAAGDVPEHFNVALWHQPNPEDNVGGSKAVGEPPFMLGISVWEAIRDAVAQARAKAGLAGPVKLDAPATAERVLWAVQAGSDD